MSSEQDRTEENHAPGDVRALDRTSEEELLPQLVAHLREHRTKLRQDWAARIQEAGLI